KEVLEKNITTEKKTVVFGPGSSNGLQLQKYFYSQDIEKRKEEIKHLYNLSNYKFIIGYVGRINKSKGVKELVSAFEKIQMNYNNIALLIIGRIDEEDRVPTEIIDK